MVVPRLVYYVLGWVLALAAAFLAGRYSRPAEVKERVEFVERLQVQHTRSIDRVVDTKWRRVIETRPDGSSTTTESSESHTVEKDNTKTETTKSAETAKTTNTVNHTARWSIFVTGGATVYPGFQAPESLRPHFGLILTGRIAGPLKFSAYGLSSGSLGAGLGFEF